MSDQGDRIGRLLTRAPVFDGHNDLAWALRKQVAYDLSQRDIATTQPRLHTDIPRLRAGGVGAQFFSVYVPGTLVGGAAVTATLEQIDCVSRIIAAYPETFEAARTASDVRRVISGGRISIAWRVTAAFSPRPPITSATLGRPFDLNGRA